MNTIEFNKKYTKLPAGIKTARLVAVEPVRLIEQTELFCWQDTHYLEGSKNDPIERWNQLPDGDYLCLVLKSDSGAIFTTLRKDNLENRRKYMTIDRYGLVDTQGRTGKEFQIIIKEG